MYANPSDRELLELAAKAAELHYDPEKCDEVGRSFSENLGLWIWHWCDWWNPLTYDGDALRLLAQMKFAVSWTTCFVRVAYAQEEYIEGEDATPALCRAIVRAAAEIGKSMK